MTGTTTSGKPLSQENLDKVMEACEMAFKLDEDKQKVRERATAFYVASYDPTFSSCSNVTFLQFVESFVASITPNLSLNVGPENRSQALPFY